VICSRCKLLGCRLKGIARELPVAHRMGWLVLGLRPAVENGVRSDSKEVWESTARSSRNVLRASRWRRFDRNGGACALMKVLIGVDPHKGSVAVAAVDEASGELIERASFPQDLEKA
jgi:hypothetical protein